MCGFLVQFSKENKNFQNFELANDLLEHRGPDSTKYIESKENFKFGFKRLSILDLDSQLTNQWLIVKKTTSLFLMVKYTISIPLEVKLKIQVGSF